MRQRTILQLPLIFGLLLATTVTAAEFIPLGVLPGATQSIVRGVSDDGFAVAGFSYYVRGTVVEAFRWSEETGLVGLGILPGYEDSFAGGGFGNGHGISGDGSVVVGYSRNSVPVTTFEAYVHKESTGIQSLTHLEAIATATSFDGSTVVGWGGPIGGRESEAFRWTENEGLVGLGVLPGHCCSTAADVSDDGSVIVGGSNFSGLGQTVHSFRWTDETGMVDLGLASGSSPYPTVSSDGSTIAGTKLSTWEEAYRWTESTGVVGLGWLPGTANSEGDNKSEARGINGDGSIIVGVSGSNPSLRRGFIWTEQHGMEDLQQVLVDRYGLGDRLSGWILAAPNDISSNGQFITGTGMNPEGHYEGWLVRLDLPFLDMGGLPGDYNSNGLVEQADLDLVLLHWGADAASIPATWTNDLPMGVIDQQELDKVLLHWGEKAALAGASGVPEPQTAVLLIIAFAAALVWRQTGSGFFFRGLKSLSIPPTFPPRKKNPDPLRGALTIIAAALVALPWTCASSMADTFGSGPNEFEIEFVEIGNPGNEPDTTGCPNPAGAVDYVYNIGKYEISRSIIDHANQAGDLGITLHDMDVVTGGPRPEMPASGVSWNEAAHFVNWLNTSRGFPGAYKFATQPGDEEFDANANILLWEEGDRGFDPENRYRNSEAKYFLPSVHEWYKAAYYDPNAGHGEGAYWDFPTGSDMAPTPVTSGTQEGTAVYFHDTLQGPADVTEAGGLSPYGVMALGGNLWEWQETEFDQSNDDVGAWRTVRGGGWADAGGPELIPLDLTAAVCEYWVHPHFGSTWRGFRVASAANLLVGDYNNNGFVEQADLDLVLLHWGDDAANVPATWMNDLPAGAIDQEELDKVLLRWGQQATSATAAAVPEPTSVALLLSGLTVGMGLCVCRRISRPRIGLRMKSSRR